jgi:hypothetical protein
MNKKISVNWTYDGLVNPSLLKNPDFFLVKKMKKKILIVGLLAHH